ncbi:MAG: 2-oxoacid:acceptor oxidoreductase subunit alpha [Candidatus Bathyarchaeota archaeon]|nr:MAG: 2-oxoacid:acceptor oxidoreductase subunit alpha [Candidatus Bathyarchaeota archaeon]
MPLQSDHRDRAVGGFTTSIKCIIGNSLSFLVGGEAGQGITRSGSLLGKAIMRGGFHVYGANDYPSVIRGGHNLYTLRVSDEEIHSQHDLVDLILALNKETLLLHQTDLNEGGGAIYDDRIELEDEDITREDISLYPVPLSAIVDEIGGPPIMRNTVALGAAVGLVGYDLELLKQAIAISFPGRTEVIGMNQEAAQRGHDHIVKHQGDEFPCYLRPSDERTERNMLTGNDAIALGAIQAGCRFYAAYPMTPASPVLHYLINRDEETGMVVVQPESEISAINMVIGASYAGVRAMTATSGGGFSLMTEALGLAAIAETPIVVMVGQRPGPSTGMATYSAQADLLFVIHASQGDFPRVVVAPGDVEECFYRTMEAFNLADVFQVPAIILTDKNIIESHKSTEPFDLGRVGIDRGDLLEIDEWTGEEYKRFRVTESGTSPRLIPGTKGALTLANSNEHDERGFTTIDPATIEEMAGKQRRKMENLRRRVMEMEPVKVYGSADPDISLVGWGSTKGPALEALKMLEEDGVRASFLQPVYMEPFPAEAMNGALRGGGRFLLVEGNRTAQLGQLIKLHTGFAFEHVHLRYDGRPFNPGEIRDRALEAMR